MADMVKCVDCGFLALRNATTRELVEMEAELRSGEIEHISIIAPMVGSVGLGPPTYTPFPICFMRVADFKKEFLPGVRLTKVINEDRTCNEITEWHQGSTPKEHREMLDRERMLRWQERESAANRKYRLIELGLVAATMLIIIVAAFIERGGQPIIINNPPDIQIPPIQIIMPTQPPATGTPTSLP